MAATKQPKPRPKRGELTATTATLTPRGRTGLASLAMLAPAAAGRMSTSAGKQLAERGSKSRDDKLITRESWQSEAYRFTREIGELGYVANMKADVCAKGDLVVREWDLETGQIIPEDESPDRDKLDTARRVLRNMRGPVGDYHELLRWGAFHDQCAGEAHLFSLPIGDTGQYAVEFLSVLEVEEDARGQVTRKKRPKSATKKVDSETVVDAKAFVARYLRSDYEHSDMPTSPVQRVIPICHEIVGLTQMIGSIINSRLPAGALFIPNDMDVGLPDEGVGDVDGTEDEATPADVVTAHMSAPVEDRQSVAALVPLVIEGPPESGQYIRLIELAKAADMWPVDLRERAIERLATGLDIPPEVMQGKGGLNHWTGYSVDRDFVVKHVIPVGERLAQFFTVGFLRKMLVFFEDWTEEEAARFDLEYDPSTLLASDDDSANASALADRNLISGDAVIKAHGFDPAADGITPEERAEKGLWHLVLNFPAVAAQLGALRMVGIPLGADPNAPFQPEQISGIDGATADIPNAEDGTAPPASAPIEAPPVETPSAVDGMDEPSKPDMSAVVARVHGFADAALDRAMEKASARILSRADKVPAARERARSMNKRDLVSAFTADELGAIGVDPHTLLADAWDPVAQRCYVWASEALETSGMAQRDAVANARAMAARVVDALDGLALSGFVRPLPTVNGSRVPYDLIAEAMA